MIFYLKKYLVLLLVLVVSFGCFAWYSQAGPQEPDIILVGNPSVMAPEFHSKLPTGYQWVTPKNEHYLQALNSAKKRALATGEIFVAPDSKFPYVFAVLDRDTDLDSIINQARLNRKKAVYVLNMEPDPYVPVVPLSINLEQIWAKSIEKLYSWTESFGDFLITDVSAHSWPDYTCSRGAVVYAGTCLAASWEDDFPEDGKTPGALYCFHYTSRKCHWYNYGIHVYRNIGAPKVHSDLPHTSASPEPVSFVNCMKGHNGESTIKRPVDLTINFYLTAAQAGAAPGSCGLPVCGCAQQFPKTQPRTSRNGVMWIPTHDQGCNAIFNNLETVRHEVSHTYGYEHQEMDNVNNEDVAHCINGGSDGQTQYPPVHTMF